MKVAKDLLHMFRVLVIDFKIFKQRDAESLGTFVILLAVQMPFFAMPAPADSAQVSIFGRQPKPNPCREFSSGNFPLNFQ